MQKTLVIGGAGYIGSHMARMLCEQGQDVVVFDNLSTGHRWAVGQATLVEGDILDRDALDKLFVEYGAFDLVIHFGARSLVGESVSDPQLYYVNNVAGTLNLLQAMVASGHTKLVFSSTAAVYGMPEVTLIDESQPKQPINPYGASKWMVEQMLGDFQSAYGLNSVCLRYFNAAGADPSAEIGEAHEPETHLIPNVLKAVLGQGNGLKVFGDDYATRDGSCVRDYVHVNDLCRAHLLAGEYMQTNAGAHAFNLGNGNGFSVLEIIAAAEQVVGQRILYDVLERRPGDPDTLVANASRARESLGWVPEYQDIVEIIGTAWRWHNKKSPG